MLPDVQVQIQRIIEGEYTNRLRDENRQQRLLESRTTMTESRMRVNLRKDKQLLALKAYFGVIDVKEILQVPNSKRTPNGYTQNEIADIIGIRHCHMSTIVRRVKLGNFSLIFRPRPNNGGKPANPVPEYVRDLILSHEWNQQNASKSLTQRCSELNRGKYPF